MGKVVYLAVRVKLSAEKEPDEELLRWCLRSFEFRANPIPDIEFELRSVWGHDVLVFYRKSPETEKEITPLDLPDEILGGFISSADDSETTAEEFERKFLFLVRLDAALSPTGDARIISLTAQSALGTANFYIRGLRNFDSIFDQEDPNPVLFHLYNKSSDTFWCAVWDTTKPEETAKEPSTEKPPKEIDPTKFVKKDGEKRNG